MGQPMCPECTQGKCRNCDGEALDEATDQIGPCRCQDCAELAADDAARAQERHESWWV